MFKECSGEFPQLLHGFCTKSITSIKTEVFIIKLKSEFLAEFSFKVLCGSLMQDSMLSAELDISVVVVDESDDPTADFFADLLVLFNL